MSSYEPPGSELHGAAPTEGQPFVPQAFVAEGAAGGAPRNNPRSSTGRTVALTVVGTLLVIGLGVASFLIGRSGSENAAPTTTEGPPTTVTTTSVTSTLAPPPETTAPPETAEPVEAVAPEPEIASRPIGDVRDAPTGLLCRDLKARGYSYSAAVEYWRVHGQPDRMDSDRNGIPCETVYSRSDIVAYWPAAVYQATPWYGLPSGLLCRDLLARGIDVYGALSYFIADGYPSRMDADGNGIPCETVYPDAALIWTRGY